MQNFEEYLIIMQRGDWKKHIKVKSEKNYTTSVTELINKDLMKSGQH